MNDKYAKNFDGWNEAKKQLDKKQKFPKYFQERDVWWCAVGVNIGAEEDGKNENFERPVVVIKKLTKDLLLVIPTTTTIREGNFYHNIPEWNGTKSQVVLAQIKVLSSKRLLRRMYRISNSQYSEIVAKLIALHFINKAKSPRKAGKSQRTSVQMYKHNSKPKAKSQAMDKRRKK